MLLPVMFNVRPLLADYSRLLQLQSQGDYAQVVPQWQKLANAGDPVAQYNLALLYEKGTGVTQDSNVARYWFSMAARQGLAEAYASLNAKSIKATTQKLLVKQIETAAVPQQWVSAQNPRYYTLQLASSTNKALIEKYYQENQLSGNAGYYRSKREGEYWYALVYGAYPSVNAAKEAIDSLPEDLKKWSPWVRNIRSIHKIMEP